MENYTLIMEIVLDSGQSIRQEISTLAPAEDADECVRIVKNLYQYQFIDVWDDARKKMFIIPQSKIEQIIFRNKIE